MDKAYVSARIFDSDQMNRQNKAIQSGWLVTIKLILWNFRLKTIELICVWIGMLQWWFLDFLFHVRNSMCEENVYIVRGKNRLWYISFQCCRLSEDDTNYVVVVVFLSLHFHFISFPIVSLFIYTWRVKIMFYLRFNNIEIVSIVTLSNYNFASWYFAFKHSIENLIHLIEKCVLK